MSKRVAKWLGIDITTTEMALAVSDREDDGFTSIKMRGATHWKGDSSFPAFDLRPVPEMLLELLASLSEEGWRFDDAGSLSVACRQHDMVVLDEHGRPLLPALSWQCNAARREVEQLNGDPRVTAEVGRVEERFILPKLACVLEIDSGLRDRVASVMTTGDWVLGNLTGIFRLSTSDALSNGLLNQESRGLAGEVLRIAGLDPGWFPEVVQSGHPIGDVPASDDEPDDAWRELRDRLSGWQAVAGLGDNHASALGCGMRDDRTIVVSAGTSGTVNLAVPADAVLNPVDDAAARFEFYRGQSLLLRMLAYCGDWYNRFVDEFTGEYSHSHETLNDQALDADLQRVRRVKCGRDGECYPSDWTSLSLAEQVASVQYSIAAELLHHVKKALAEAPSARNARQYVLTGGLSQSAFFQNVFRSGIELLAHGKDVKVSGRTGPLRYKTSASGALLNARMPEWEYNLANLPEELFPLADCVDIEAGTSDILSGLLRHELLD